MNDSGRKQAQGHRSARTGVYTGGGTSHSWLWFIDIFDRTGFRDVVLMDERAIRQGKLDHVDVLTVSGGDTVAIARALGPKGAGEIERFVQRGGCYIGTCAGAYLVMNSSKPHLNDFNFVPVRITNLSNMLPDCRCLSHKFSMVYGCDYVFHPVREAVELSVPASAPFADIASVTAPLYGGPGMSAGAGVQEIAFYRNFTSKTVFLVEEELARETLIGKAAAVRMPYGRGCFYLFGPHFEHPRYAAANRMLCDVIRREGKPSLEKDGPPGQEIRCLTAAATADLRQCLKRELSNARIVAAGIEMSPVRWRIGAKTYEPEKIRVFLESMFRRVRVLEKHRHWVVGKGIAREISAHARKTTDLLRKLKTDLDHDRDTLETAAILFAELQRYATAFFDIYFNTRRDPSPRDITGVTIEDQHSTLAATVLP